MASVNFCLQVQVCDKSIEKKNRKYESNQTANSTRIDINLYIEDWKVRQTCIVCGCTCMGAWAVAALVTYMKRYKKKMKTLSMCIKNERTHVVMRLRFLYGNNGGITGGVAVNLSNMYEI